MESGLVGLRAELQKKRVEANKLGPGQRGPALGRREREAARPKSFSASNTGVSSRAARDEEQRLADERTEEKAKSVLEKKAAMYDSLQRGVEVLQDDNLNQRFLVNFQKKIVDDVLKKKQTREEAEAKRREEQKQRETANPEAYAAEDDGQEWVEYVDAFGRTRECLREELPQRLDQDQELARDLNPPEAEAAPLDPHQLEDLHRQALHQRWEVEEEVNATKKDLHYQDVLYDEARSHGPGYLKFSRDEKERKAQMELLRDLRAETQRAGATTAAAAARKQKAMKARLEKVRQRKRLKMGLPMKEDDRLKTPPGSEEEDEEEEAVVGPAPAPPSPPPKRKVGGVREWDLGKEGVTSTLTQEEWVLRQRSQRSQEFAPPSSYHSRGSGSQVPPPPSYQPSERGERQDSPSPPPSSREHFREERQPEFAPPATHEYYGPASRGRAPRRAPPPDIEAAITKGLAHLRKMSG